MKLRYSQARAFTLVEMTVAAGVFMVLSAAIVSGVVALQRNFANTTDYALNHSAQLRISDFIARDLRQAVTFSQTGTGTGLSMTMDVPNYYDPTVLDPATKQPTPRDPTLNADGTISYQQGTGTTAVKLNRVRYFMSGERIYREVDGAAKPIAEDVANFLVIPLDSAADPTASTDFNLSAISGKVAQVKVQVNFKTHFGSKSVTQTFYNTTLMRNARTDAQTSLY
jgi:type II secretory pathway component PulJ